MQGATSPALDSINKSTTAISWAYGPTLEAVMANDTKVFGSRKVPWVAGTGIDPINIALWGKVLAADAAQHGTALGLVCECSNGRLGLWLLPRL